MLVQRKDVEPRTAYTPNEVLGFPKRMICAVVMAFEEDLAKWPKIFLIHLLEQLILGAFEVQFEKGDGLGAESPHQLPQADGLNVVRGRFVVPNVRVRRENRSALILLAFVKRQAPSRPAHGQRKVRKPALGALL